VVAIEKRFVPDSGGSFWSFCVTYLADQDNATAGVLGGRRKKIDYREVLSAEDFALFAKLRELRNQVARDEGVAAYLVFTNEQLARMVQDRVRTRTALLEIPGVGQARTERYGKVFLTLLQQMFPAQEDHETPQNTSG